jgi:PAS domain S-box-containing protein
LTPPEPEERQAPAPQPEAEIVQLASAQNSFFQRELLYRDLLNALPAAIYTTDAEGRITFYNEAAAAFAGRRPAIGELWCVTWRLYNADGSPLLHSECPMAIALKEGRPVRDAEAIAERPDGSRAWFIPYPTPLYDEAGRLTGAVNMLVDITERKAVEEQQRLLTHEVNHRANNLLAVVQAIVRLTRGATVAAFKESVGGRLEALARAHAQLAKSRWTQADLQALVTEELAPYMEEQTRAWIGGRPLPLRPSAAQSLALIIHELTTNAARFGALSTEAGEVHVDWRLNRRGDLLIRWREEGGPEATPPSRRGVGSTVIARAAALLDGAVTYAWLPAGLQFEFRAPFAMVRSD